MNAQLVRNVLSLAVLMFAMAIGFQVAVPDAAAASLACEQPWYSQCLDDCHDDWFFCRQDAFANHAACQSQCYAVYDVAIEACEGRQNQVQCENQAQNQLYGCLGGCQQDRTYDLNQCDLDEAECNEDCADLYCDP